MALAEGPRGAVYWALIGLALPGLRHARAVPLPHTLSLSQETASSTRYVIMGVSGAGKTAVGERLAIALHVDFVEGDRLHSPESVARMSAGMPLTDEDRQGWLETIAKRLREARAKGVGLVVACSALKRRYRDILREADPEVRFIHLAGDRPLLADRLEHRAGHFMPASLLASQFESLQPPDADEGAWTVDVSVPVDEIVHDLMARIEVAHASHAHDAPTRRHDAS